MKTDLYTKVLLTLITIFLGVLASDRIYETAIPKAEAEESTPTWMCGSTTTLKAGGDSNIRAKIKKTANKYQWTTMTSFNQGNWWIWCGRK